MRALLNMIKKLFACQPTVAMRDRMRLDIAHAKAQGARKHIAVDCGDLDVDEDSVLRIVERVSSFSRTYPGALPDPDLSDCRHGKLVYLVPANSDMARKTV